MARTVVILHDTEENFQTAQELAEFFKDVSDRVVVASKTEWTGAGEGAVIPAEADSEPRIRNWITSCFASAGGFLHVVSDRIKVQAGCKAFLADLEAAMKAFDYPVWLSTVTDGCNYVYGKYNPRIRICADRPECAALGIHGDICFTSHSNMMWVAYDLDGIKDNDLLRVDERFTVAMYFIIEFLARRKRLCGAESVCLMNQYMTVGSEQGAFSAVEEKHPSERPKPEIMQAEDKAFKEMNIDYSPDNSVDLVLERFWEKIKSKTAAV